MPSKSKAKAVKAFLSGISDQIPDHALSLLVKDAKAIRVLLHKSIEALPMGSPIRKSIDEDLEHCIKIMKLEVESRMKQIEERKETEEVAEAETTFYLPNFNDELIQYNLIHATHRKDKAMLKELHCLDSTNLEMLVTKKDAIDDILNKFSSRIVCGRLSATDLNSFIGLVANAFVNMDDPKSVIRCIKSFLKLFQISTGLCDVEDIDHEVAIDLGKIMGILVVYALAQSELYKSVLDEACTADGSDDESSDEEDSSRPVKRRKISIEERKRIYADCKNDVLRVISLVFSNFSNSKEERKIAACLAFGYVDSILLGNDSLASCCLKNEKVNVDAVQKDGSKVLVNALEICNVAPRKDLPNAYLLSKGSKMCSLLQTWAKNAAGSIEHVGVSNISSKNEESESENDSDEPSDDNNTNDEEVIGMTREVEDEDDDIDDEEMVGTTVNANDEKQDDVQNEKDDSSVKEVASNPEDCTKDNASNEENTTTTTKNNRASKKKVISALPPVPEDEEADVEVEINVDIADNKEKEQSPQKQSSRATRPRKRTDSASSQETPTRTRKSRTSTGNGSILESLGTEDVPDTPSRRTRSRTESNASETSVSTPLRRSTRARGESNASETSVSTPLRRSTRARGDSSASEISINTPRRSARKKK